MNDVMLSLVVAECKPEVERTTGSIEDKAQAAMRVAKDHWMVLDRDVQFRGSIGALLIHYGKDSPEYERIASELDSLRKLSAILQAAQAGLSVNLSEDDVPKHESLGLLKMWQDIIAEEEK